VPIVECIRTLDAFESVRSRWETVYGADPRANSFVSWSWLHAYLPLTPYKWFILAVRAQEDAEYSAFLPLAWNLAPKGPVAVYRELEMAGKPPADYTGFVCAPEFEDEALGVLSEHVASLNFDGFKLDDVLDERVERFLQPFARARFHIEPRGSAACPYIDLPSTWEDYLARLGSGTRRDLRRALRALEAVEGFRLSYATPQTAAEHVDALLDMHHARWAAGYSAALRRRVRRSASRLFGRLLLNALREGCATVAVAWSGETPVAAQAAFTDRIKGSFSGYMIAHNGAYARLAPGKGLMAMTIRDAIASGYKLYDFTRGAEEYKFQLSTSVRESRHFTVTRKTLRSRIVNFVRNRLAGTKARLIAAVAKQRKSKMRQE